MLLSIIAADGKDEYDDGQIIDIGWEHVSVHAFDPHFSKERTPRWSEMAFLKDLFWNEDECVVQYHPAKKDYVNVHDHVLHLWRLSNAEFPMPPKICV